MDKEIVIEPAELTAEEQRKAEEAKKAFGKILKKAFKRAPVRSCGIFSDSDDDDEEGSEEDDNSEE